VIGFLGAFSDSIVHAWTDRLAAVGTDFLVARVRDRRERPEDGETVGASAQDRRAAYEDFRRACVQLRVSLGVLVAGPPRIVGALWTYPVHLRLLNRSPAEAARVMDTFLTVELVGRPEAIGASEQTLQALNAVIAAYARGNSERGTARGVRQRELSDLFETLDQSLVDLTFAVRKDLGYSAPGPSV
jgi:hypothetical protein